MNFIKKIKKEIKTKVKIFFPESYSIRVLKAVSILKKSKFVNPVLIGQKNKIENLSKTNNINLKEIEIININESEDNTEKTFNLLNKNLDASAILGVKETTRKVLKNALSILEKNSDLISSYNVLYKKSDVFIFSDCSVNIDITSEKYEKVISNLLPDVKLFLTENNIAVLSYATDESGKGLSVDKIKGAIENFKIDKTNIKGPIQFDAAVSERAAKHKNINFKNHNIFIFPNLEASNISYKILENIAGFNNLGPVIKGFKNTFIDLSRSASTQDILNSAIFLAFLKNKNL